MSLEVQARAHVHTHCSDASARCLFKEKDLKVNQEASFMVQRNGARGVVDAKVHTPSGSSEECYVTELDSGTLRTRLCCPVVYQMVIGNLCCFQTRTRSASFHGRTECIPLMSSSMGATFPEAPLMCGWETPV